MNENRHELHYDWKWIKDVARHKSGQSTLGAPFFKTKKDIIKESWRLHDEKVKKESHLPPLPKYWQDGHQNGCYGPHGDHCFVSLTLSGGRRLVVGHKGVPVQIAARVLSKSGYVCVDYEDHKEMASALEKVRTAGSGPIPGWAVNLTKDRMQELLGFERDYETTTSQLAEATARIAVLNDIVEDSTSKAESTNRRLEDARKETGQCKQRIDALDSMVNSLHARKEVLASKVSAISAKADSIVEQFRYSKLPEEQRLRAIKDALLEVIAKETKL